MAPVPPLANLLSQLMRVCVSEPSSLSKRPDTLERKMRFLTSRLRNFSGVKMMSCAMLHSDVGAVHLRPVPPVRDDVAIGCRPPLVRRSALVIRAGRQDGHFRRGPIVAFGNGEAQRRALRVVDAVTEPIMHHELQPSRQKNIDGRCRHEFAARQQFAADHARIGFVEAGRLFTVGLRQRSVAAEPCIGHAHSGLR